MDGIGETIVERLLNFRFTQQQREAVCAPTDRLQKVVAGAGTGKTQVIVGRFLYLVVEKGVEARKILCVTFTDYAADEMRTRLNLALDKAQQLKEAVEVAGAESSSVFTFHSFCDRILREYRQEAQLPEEFTILSGGERDILLEGRVKEEILSSPLQFEFITTANFRHLYRTVVDLMDEARKDSLSAEELEQKVGFALEKEQNTPYKRYRKELLSLCLCVWRSYEELKKQAEALDYDDLILKTIELLETNDAVRDEVRQRYEYILVDEYQDTDRMQQKLLNLIAQEGLSNVTVVGDVRQAIYTWRGAYPENLSLLDGVERRLDFNFRSHNEILLLANEISNADTKLPESKLKNPGHGEPSEKRIFLFLGKDRKAQAEFVSEHIQTLQKRGYELDEIAILSRSKDKLQEFEDALGKCSIPYKSLSRSVYDSPIVMDVAQWMRILSGALTKSTLVGVLSRSPFCLTPEELSPLHSLDETFSLDDVRRLGGAITEAAEKIQAFVARSGLRLTIPALLISAVQIVGVSDEQEVANFERIFEKAVAFQSSRQLYKPLDFAEYLERMHKSKADEPQSNPYLRYGAVKLLTIHSSKGLEFDIVFIVDVTDKRNIVEKVLLDLEGRGIIAEKLPYEKEKRSEYEDLSKEIKEERDREERRLLHVAVTRARKFVYITGQVQDNRRKFNTMLDTALESESIKPFIHQVRE